MSTRYTCHTLMAAMILILGSNMNQAMAHQLSEPESVLVPNSYYVDWQEQEETVHRIFVSVPEGDTPEQGFPVVYLMDGNAFFAAAVEMSRQLVSSPSGKKQPTIIIGIGYPIQTSHDFKRRWFDLTPPTPTPPKAPLQHMKRYKGVQYGGAQKMLNFITQTLRPWLAKQHLINPSEQILFGHSLGGLFTLYALNQQPEAFSGYGAISPSLWWNENYLMSRLEQQDPAPRVHKEVLMVLGADEKEFMLSDSAKVKTWFEAQGIHSERRVMDYMNHGVVAVPALSMALQVLLPAAPAKSQ